MSERARAEEGDETAKTTKTHTLREVALLMKNKWYWEDEGTEVVTLAAFTELMYVERITTAERRVKEVWALLDYVPGMRKANQHSKLVDLTIFSAYATAEWSPSGRDLDSILSLVVHAEAWDVDADGDVVLRREDFARTILLDGSASTMRRVSELWELLTHLPGVRRANQHALIVRPKTLCTAMGVV